MILLIDNYDSFTYNLVHYLAEVGAETNVVRNDKISVDEVLKQKPKGIVISPGPCTPNEAGICLDLVQKTAGQIPLLGVCLGHQAIAQSFGAKIIKAPVPVHGKTSEITNTSEGIFAGTPQRFEVTRYHSLIVKPDSLSDEFKVTAKTDDDIIMAIQHRQHNVHGVQFHPESIASQHGHDILRNFVESL